MKKILLIIILVALNANILKAEQNNPRIVQKKQINSANSLVTVNGIVINNRSNNTQNIVRKKKIYHKAVAKKQASSKQNIITHQTKHSTNNKTNTIYKPSTQQTGSLAVFAVDADTGTVLFSKQAYEKRYPASLTKMMTLYILFDKLDKNEIRLNDKIYFSKYAASKPRMKLGVLAGQYVTVREAISAIIVLSANDVATAVGEYLAGSEANFSKMMNFHAKRLKMHNTNFSNASGLFHPAQKTTAADMVKLGISLQNDFPQYFKYFSETNFNFRGRTINGHNKITSTYYGATGLKTGYISQSGFNLASSANRNGKTIFATILGGRTAQERDSYMKKLLDASFSKIDNNRAKV